MHNEARLRLFRANTLVDLVKKVSIDLKLDPSEKADETKDNKRRRIIQVAQSFKQQQLEVFFKENGKKYCHSISNYSKKWIRYVIQIITFSNILLGQVLSSFFSFSSLNREMKQRTRNADRVCYLASYAI